MVDLVIFFFLSGFLFYKLYTTFGKESGAIQNPFKKATVEQTFSTKLPTQTASQDQANQSNKSPSSKELEEKKDANIDLRLVNFMKFVDIADNEKKKLTETNARSLIASLSNFDMEKFLSSTGELFEFILEAMYNKDLIQTNMPSIIPIIDKKLIEKLYSKAKKPSESPGNKKSLLRIEKTSIFDITTNNESEYSISLLIKSVQIDATSHKKFSVTDRFVYTLRKIQKQEKTNTISWVLSDII